MPTNLELEALLQTCMNPGLKAIDLSLDRVHTFLNAIGNPEQNLAPVVHVAGTNGKGSTLAFVQSILEVSGYKVHKYTSPHLVRFNERIILAGEEATDAQLIEAISYVRERYDIAPLTYFEATTIAAFILFSQVQADIVLLETGLGGRLDTTNVIAKPAVTAITPISIDHQEYLGETLEKIATEKAGIIKHDVPCVIAQQESSVLGVLKDKAMEMNAPIVLSESITLPQLPQTLIGEHQEENAKTAIACVQQLTDFSITQDAIERGVQNAQWPARLQHLTHGSLQTLLSTEDQLWLDGGHNPAAAHAIAHWCETNQVEHLTCVISMLNDKDIEGFLTPLAPHITKLIAVPIPNEPKAHEPQSIAAIAKKLGIDVEISHTVEKAIQQQKSNLVAHHTFLICGSLYLAGTVLEENS